MDEVHGLPKKQAWDRTRFKSHQEEIDALIAEGKAEADKGQPEKKPDLREIYKYHLGTLDGQMVECLQKLREVVRSSKVLDEHWAKLESDAVLYYWWGEDEAGLLDKYLFYTGLLENTDAIDRRQVYGSGSTD